MFATPLIYLFSAEELDLRFLAIQALVFCAPAHTK